MKLIVTIGTDYQLNHLPHFLRHYSDLGVERFLCGLQGSREAEARQILAAYPAEIVTNQAAARFDEVSSRYWKDQFNTFRRKHVAPDEWCLYADADELHEYPLGFFAKLDPQINVIRGKWIERLATSDGQLCPCRPDGNIGQQFPFGTREIFSGISEKIMATRGDLELVFDDHWLTGSANTPVYYESYLNVHHFRWDDQAIAKYDYRSWTPHYQFANGRVPDLRGVFTVDPPFPEAAATGGDQQQWRAQNMANGQDHADAKAAPPVIWLVGDGRSGTTWLANVINYHQAYRVMFEPLHPGCGAFFRPKTPIFLFPHPRRRYTGRSFNRSFQASCVTSVWIAVAQSQRRLRPTD